MSLPILPQPPLRPFVLLGFLILVAAAGASSGRHPSPQAHGAPATRPVDRENALVDTHSGQEPALGEEGIPTQVQEWQKRPPCSEEADEHPIRGACWQATSRKPPCGKVLRVYGGACYRPVARSEQPPVSGH